MRSKRTALLFLGCFPLSTLAQYAYTYSPHPGSYPYTPPASMAAKADLNEQNPIYYHPTLGWFILPTTTSTTIASNVALTPKDAATPNIPAAIAQPPAGSEAAKAEDSEEFTDPSAAISAALSVALTTPRSQPPLKSPLTAAPLPLPIIASAAPNTVALSIPTPVAMPAPAKAQVPTPVPAPAPSAAPNPVALSTPTPVVMPSAPAAAPVSTKAPTPLANDLSALTEALTAATAAANAATAAANAATAAANAATATLKSIPVASPAVRPVAPGTEIASAQTPTYPTNYIPPAYPPSYSSPAYSTGYPTGIPGIPNMGSMIPGMGGMGGGMGGMTGFPMMGTSATQSLKPYNMRRIISQDEKRMMVQMMLPIMTNFMQMTLPDIINYFTRKYPAKQGISFDDVVESMKLAANKQNLKMVGENLMWKDFHAVLNDKTAPRVEVYSFCDIAVGRELLKLSPEASIFLPCRISIIEDANKQIWVQMLDWNPAWVMGYRERLGISDALWEGAISVHDRMDFIMRAAANGDL